VRSGKVRVKSEQSHLCQIENYKLSNTAECKLHLYASMNLFNVYFTEKQEQLAHKTLASITPCFNIYPKNYTALPK